jgi:RNA polymerase sigma-70 factor (ECF subfamily)
MPPPSSFANPTPAAERDSARWFADEVKPHESQLRSYLQGRFPGVRDVDDVVQESYLRIWKARAAHPIDSAKGFLFTIARHLAIDWVKKSQATAEIEGRDLLALSVVDQEPDAFERLSYQEKVDLLSDVLAELPDRCREIVVLRRLRCLPQKEVAARLGISERTVENLLARGLQRCVRSIQHRRRRGFDSP